MKRAFRVAGFIGILLTILLDAYIIYFSTSELAAVLVSIFGFGISGCFLDKGLQPEKEKTPLGNPKERAARKIHQWRDSCHKSLLEEIR